MNKDCWEEDLMELSENIWSLIEKANVPTDQDGFSEGYYKVRIEWHEDPDE